MRIKLDDKKMPKHIAIIMDGNGRWAKQRLMPRSFGHKVGVDRIKHIVDRCIELNIDTLTLYALSCENLARPQAELDVLFDLFREYFTKQFDILIAQGVKFLIMGDISVMPQDIQDKMNSAIDRSKSNTKLKLNIAINYGGRQEIVRAVNLAIADKKEVTIDSFNDYLYTNELPELDLIIRTGGDLRLSNFLLYQCAYAELYFTTTMWPAFDGDCLDRAIFEFQKRNRRFGKV